MRSFFFFILVRRTRKPRVRPTSISAPSRIHNIRAYGLCLYFTHTDTHTHADIYTYVCIFIVCVCVCVCSRTASDRRIIEDEEDDDDDDDDHDGNWPRYPYTHVRDLQRQGHSPRVLTVRGVEPPPPLPQHPPYSPVYHIILLLYIYTQYIIILRSSLSQ
jgi:hypothetical protein